MKMQKTNKNLVIATTIKINTIESQIFQNRSNVNLALCCVYEESAYLFLEELGEVSLGLNGSDIASEITPYQAPALDVQNEKRRRGARH